MIKKSLALALLLGGTLTFCACKNENEAQPMTQTLYERLGGVNAITAVVDQFIMNVAADPKMVRTFTPLLQDVQQKGGADKSARFQSLRNNLIDQIGEASGGPQKYKGKDMVTAHKGMKITDDEFNSLVNDLVNSLNKFNVPQKEQQELLTVLGGLKPQIVAQ